MDSKGQMVCCNHKGRKCQVGLILKWIKSSDGSEGSDWSDGPEGFHQIDFC